jgi:hypothetical protein
MKIRHYYLATRSYHRRVARRKPRPHMCTERMDTIIRKSTHRRLMFWRLFLVVVDTSSLHKMDKSTVYRREQLL